MKVVHINTYDGNGGAGRACLRLNKALKDAGCESAIYVSYKFGNNKSIGTFSKGKAGKALTAFRIVSERLLSSLVTKKVKIPFSLPVWGTNITRNRAVRNADIIHLHWINHAFLRPREIASLYKLGKPVVWTFHDSNAFTGGCHVRYSCEHFENECGNCPLLKRPNPDDHSHRTWLAKERAYARTAFTVIAPSSWMKESVKRSKLLADRETVVIPNTLDTTVFRPKDRDAARARLGIDVKAKVMIRGFMPSRKDLHKGTPYLLDALDLLATNNMIDPDSVLVVFGNRDEKNVPSFPYRTIFLGTIADDEHLADCYNAGDVFITPSLEDNLPNTVMESLACGTPVAAFTTGGIPDMVTHLVNGYLAEYCSPADLAHGIATILNFPEPVQFREAARDTIELHFSEKTVAARRLELYHRILEEKAP